MITDSLYQDYLKGKCAEVWKMISFVDYSTLKAEEKTVIRDIIQETLVRIDYNVRMVFEILHRYGFKHQNFGDINRTGVSYLRKPTVQRNPIIEAASGLHLPVFFAEFCNYFEVIDFRGKFDSFDVLILLDPLFIEAFKDQREIEDLSFDLVFQEEDVRGYMFSPDHYIKEDASGSLGACLILSENRPIDNYVANYFDEFNFTFIEYLRFAFNWACFLNLYWADEKDVKNLLPILNEVRNSIKEF